VVHEINKTSNNLAARHLMLSLSRGFPLQAATLAGARERAAGLAATPGPGPPATSCWTTARACRAAERSRPRALVQLLRSAWADGRPRHFVDSLPVAGVDGTLAHRLQGGAAAGQAFLKTGTCWTRGRWRATCARAVARACGGGVRQPRQRGTATPAIDGDRSSWRVTADCGRRWG
jgi:D-alanyl-D-alanine carboxypeptidase